jgi:hypothetical protein
MRFHQTAANASDSSGKTIAIKHSICQPVIRCLNFFDKWMNHSDKHSSQLDGYDDENIGVDFAQPERICRHHKLPQTRS